jgi:hypothetical protein
MPTAPHVGGLQGETSCATSRESIMAIQPPTLRDVKTLKPQAKRYEVFDASIPVSRSA